MKIHMHVGVKMNPVFLHFQILWKWGTVPHNLNLQLLACCQTHNTQFKHATVMQVANATQLTLAAITMHAYTA